MAQEKILNPKKRKITLVVLILIFVVLTIIIFWPRNKLVSTKTYEIFDISCHFSMAITHNYDFSITYVDENNKFLDYTLSEHDLKDVVYLTEDSQKVTVENWGRNGKINKIIITAVYLNEQTYTRFLN